MWAVQPAEEQRVLCHPQKNSRNSQSVEVPRRSSCSPTCGKSGIPQPARENPLELIQLDLRDTFEFVATAAKGTQDYERVRPTIKILGLNDRDDVVKARRNAFGNYSARLEQYITRRDGGATANKLGRLRNCAAPA